MGCRGSATGTRHTAGCSNACIGGSAWANEAAFTWCAPPWVGLTQSLKHRHAGKVVCIEVCHVLGEPIACPSAVHEERLNWVLYDRLNCLKRKTHAFAKQAQTWNVAVFLGLFKTNWLCPHLALREPANDQNGLREQKFCVKI